MPQVTYSTTREMQLIMSCARRRLTPEDAARIATLIDAGLDWSRVPELALRHKMAPLVFWHLREGIDGVPASVAATLRRISLQNAQRMLVLSAELVEIAESFAQRGVLLAPYKGPVLGVHLYGNLALRQAGDLDLLVRRGDVPPARALLLERGYRPRHVLSRGGEEFMLRSRYSEVLDRHDGSTVELHWAFTNGDVALPLDLEQFMPGLRPVPFGGSTILMFADADLLLILCVHGSKHRWDRVEWLCGVSELLRRSSAELDWAALMSRASAAGARRMLLLGVLLAHDLLGAPVPKEVLQRARSDRTVPGLAVQVPKLFTTEARDGDDASNLPTDLFRLRLRERLRDRIRFVWYRFTTPSRPESWSAVRLGTHWLPLHGILRPLRVLPKLISAVRGRISPPRVNP